ncbi:MAG TPA: NIPSNAP family protein, partial [Hyphomonadaceae bacterium]|nr:NIPSNAP family protein [Hyphomonadaceae bacterium]
YARTWGQAIPLNGADLYGYFAPHEGSATTAYGVYTIESLAAYEAYRARLMADPLGQENYAFAKQHQFIRREDRVFLKLCSGPHAKLVKP